MKSLNNWLYLLFIAVSSLLLGKTPTAAQEARDSAYVPSISNYVKVETSKGDLILALYDETPRHRDNFLSLVKSGAYEGIIFHRVIPRFMVQTGNLLTRNATATMDVSRDTIKERLPAEILPDKFFQKRGVLAAARQSNEVNPQKESSKTQFYVVTGSFFTDWDLDDIEKDTGRKFTPYQREVYKTIGGAPHLDGEYTIFGEVVEGMDTIEKIENAKTNDQNRPKKDIRIKKIYVVAKPEKP